MYFIFYPLIVIDDISEFTEAYTGTGSAKAEAWANEEGVASICDIEDSVISVYVVSVIEAEEQVVGWDVVGGNGEVLTVPDNDLEVVVQSGEVVRGQQSQTRSVGEEGVNRIEVVRRVEVNDPFVTEGLEREG